MKLLFFAVIDSDSVCFRNYTNAADLHIGVTDSKGNVSQIHVEVAQIVIFYYYFFIFIKVIILIKVHGMRFYTPFNNIMWGYLILITVSSLSPGQSKFLQVMLLVNC